MTDTTGTNSYEPKIHTTEDGSHTLYSNRFDQHYHNPNGAVAESRHNFFEKNGLSDQLPDADAVTIFEMGFGTGLNLMILLDEYLETDSRSTIHYYSVEGYPVDCETTRNFNYSDFLAHPELVDELPVIFEQSTPGFNQFELLPDVTLHLFIGMFEDFEEQNLQADFLFHDPFSPDVNEELWTGNVFKTLAKLSTPDAILTTYSAASRARGAMAWAGWSVAREQGALGKREMTVASLNPDKLSHLKRVNEERLARRYENDDF